MRQDIKGLTRQNLESLLVKEGFPKFSSSQIFNWVYKKGTEDFSLMSNLSNRLKKHLGEKFYLSGIKVMKREKSSDRTEKFLFKLKDSSFIETVLIPEPKRNTLCLSSQAGCRFKCAFCVSGAGGFKRDLSVSEMINQYLEIGRLIHPLKVTNIVFMGVGEPLDNYNNVIKAVRIFMDGQGVYLGKRKVCISTSGIIPKIYSLAELGLGVRLSVSLHSAFNSVRSRIMPVNRKYPLPELMKSLKFFIKKERFPVTFEYLLIKGVNSSLKDADKLASLAKSLPCKINLIPYNPSPFFDWQAPLKEDVTIFKDRLKSKGVFSTLRRARGRDISAACGQLKAEIFLRKGVDSLDNKC